MQSFTDFPDTLIVFLPPPPPHTLRNPRWVCSQEGGLSVVLSPCPPHPPGKLARGLGVGGTVPKGPALVAEFWGLGADAGCASCV